MSVTLLSATLLAACGGTSAPTETTGTPAARTNTTAATPGSAAPKIPTAATKRTPEGAVVFVKYWFDLANYARMNPAKGIRTKYNAPGCESCKLEDEVISRLVEKRARFDEPIARVSEFKNIRPVGQVG